MFITFLRKIKKNIIFLYAYFFVEKISKGFKSDFKMSKQSWADLEQEKNKVKLYFLPDCFELLEKISLRKNKQALFEDKAELYFFSS